ncbi:uncharacterized protein, partial [Anabrus simplex]
RSGFFVSESKGIRHLKLQGSNKVDEICPASIRLIEHENGMCEVKYVPTHRGHQNDLSHLALTDVERKTLATDIANQIPFQAILDKIRESVTDPKLERIHLITKQDLYNIERSFNLSSKSVRHQEDGTSVEAWVNEVNSGDSPCVLFYKPQGTTSEKHPNLRSDDFVLIIMNSAQSEILKKYGSDCICTDGTHGLNSYGFELITLLVLDDLRQGFPCAFLISNRSDQEILSLFFTYIKNEVGCVSPKVFMSDLAEAFYNAWNAVMGPATMRLFCSWHVDRAWRKNIQTKVNGREKQGNVYKILRTIMQETDSVAFERMLPAVMSNLTDDPDTHEFAVYFQNNYTRNVRSWAYCYRLNSGLNTNMHIERMHGAIKYIYLHGKSVKRLDKAIYALMCFVRDKLFDRLIVLNKGKLTNIMQVYVVQENDISCNCSLVCDDCNTCIHQYACTCIDSSVKWNMCKHIHSICQLKKTQANQQAREDDSTEHPVLNVEREIVVDEEAEILAQVSRKRPPEEYLQNEKDKSKQRLMAVVDGISTPHEMEVLKRHTVSLEATINAVRTQERHAPFPQETDSQKRNIVPQRRLFSTKKKRSPPQQTLTKPEDTEVESITISLLQQN